MNSLLLLLERLKNAFSIPSPNFIGHGDIAPTRKNDPNWRFSWQQLAEKGFGNWYDDTTHIVLPPNFDHLQALRIVGYDLKDTTAAIIGFKRHWMQDTTSILNDSHKKVLYSLQKKFQ